MPEFRFIRWLDPEKRFALFEMVDTREQFIVPRSRIIPHPIFEYTHPGIDPNRLAEMAAEQQSFFGIPIFRWYMHKCWTKKNPLEVDEEDWEKAYFFPPNIDFSCVRDCVLKGGKDFDLCVEECSSW